MGASCEPYCLGHHLRHCRSKTVSIEVDGEELEDEPNGVVTDLRENREVVLGYVWHC